jgi:hypothetical protein
MVDKKNSLIKAITGRKNSLKTKFYI